jgi:hypothetical protein
VEKNFLEFCIPSDMFPPFLDPVAQIKQQISDIDIQGG